MGPNPLNLEEEPPIIEEKQVLTTPAEWFP
jgi:hypothetical protein